MSGPRLTGATVLWIGGTLAALTAAVNAGPPGGDDEPRLPRDGYTCCNLHYEGDCISGGNHTGLPMLPAEIPIKVLSLGRHRAYVLVGGNKMRLGHDYGRDQVVHQPQGSAAAPQVPH